MGTKSLAKMRHEQCVFFDPIELTGATLLDVGAWAGAHAFDLNDDGPETRAIIDHCLSFLRDSSNSMRLPNGSAT